MEVPRQDTPRAFQSFETFHEASNSARIPRGYELVAQDLGGSVESDKGFLYTHPLRQYDPGECARLCDDLPTCAAFNLYFEREPAYLPDASAGCSNPPSTTSIDCVLWHTRLDEDDVGNFGELREQFQVVITGSNLYNKINGTLDLGHMGYSGPWVGVDNEASFAVPNEPVGNYSTILDQRPLFYNSYNSSSTLNHYDPTICARLCSDITDQRVPGIPFKSIAYPVCSMFVAYELRHDVPLAMVCELYSSLWSTRYQTLREVVGLLEGGMETIPLRPTRVSVYHRNDYLYPPICAMEYQCGRDFYSGGDCSGWGKGFC
ncbi:hypothetical protein KVR01_011522 [Diaporthe batatas]|uniref:uncharacterized protein n=1 Tax=Diaporthe batatas TaxID=748121 RepID=UPI001D039290|nr:uncharacterized protein KVR01_011522 [Diaporthe batatas]KAG8158400.1 hypothetical protein KVR01_011522 [Diaporthe batatas]